MKILLILFLLFAVVGLVAIRYRRQISGMIGLARALKDANDAASQSRVIRGEAQPSVQLVNCAKCGVWVPQDKAVRMPGRFYCTNCE